MGFPFIFADQGWLFTTPTGQFKLAIKGKGKNRLPFFYCVYTIGYLCYYILTNY